MARPSRPRSSSGEGNSLIGLAAAVKPVKAVELDEEMAVGRKDKSDVQALAGGVELSLFEAMHRGEVLGLRFDQGERDRLGIGVDADPQRVVDPASRLLARLSVNDLDGAGRLLAADEVLHPASRMQGWIDQLRPGVGLGEQHSDVYAKSTTFRRSSLPAEPRGRTASLLRSRGGSFSSSPGRKRRCGSRGASGRKNPSGRRDSGGRRANAAGRRDSGTPDRAATGPP